MKFKCCHCAISDFFIVKDSLSFCKCVVGGKLMFHENYKDDDDIIGIYLKKREEFIENCKKGENIPELCHTCRFFKEKEWDTTLGINYIVLGHVTKCSCNCVYCIMTLGNEEKRKNLNKRKSRNIIPIIEKIKENGLLAKQGDIYFPDGEFAEFPSRDRKWVIKFAKENNFGLIMPSSGLFYCKEIEKALKELPIQLTISPDSGKKETFETIKRVPYYKQIWKNLEKYVKLAKKNPRARVAAKYIILDDYNDNIDEFNAFYKKCNEIGCDHIDISLDFNWIIFNNNRPAKDKMHNLVEYIKNLKDPRINMDLFRQTPEHKISADFYSETKAKELFTQNSTTKIILFAGRKETYNKISNKSSFECIWSNIKKYSEYLKTNPQKGCSIQIKYKLIYNTNDSIEELQALLDESKKCNITNIEIDIFENKNHTYTKDKIFEITQFLNANSEFNITYSQNYIEVQNEV